MAITRQLGIPDPDTNQFIVLDDGGPPIRVDFVWRDQRVIVEADSKKWHNDAPAIRTRPRSATSD